MFQSEYTLFNKINWFRGQYRSEQKMGAAFRATDFSQSVRHVDVPVFLFQGRRDWQTPTSLVERYLAELDAPLKEL